MSRARVIVRGPEEAEADAYVAEMRASRRLLRPWIVAPADRDAWDTLLARHATPEVEVLFAVRRDDGAIREGFSPRHLKVAGRWRDHERWAITAEDWRGRSH